MFLRPAVAPLVLALLCGTAAAQPPEPRVEFDLRSPDGTVLVAAADQIVAYEWATHTLTLKPGVVAELQKAMRARAWRPFVAAIGGKTVYSGEFGTHLSSMSRDGVVVLLSSRLIEREIGADRFRLDLGYPTPEFFKGEDPRADPRIRAALQAAGKLRTDGISIPTETGLRTLTGKDLETYRATNGWLEARLREAGAICIGSTYADLAKSFKRDGGLSQPTVHRFVSVLCPFLKIDVEFAARARHPLPADAKVVKVSKPYFEREYAD